MMPMSFEPDRLVPAILAAFSALLVGTASVQAEEAGFVWDNAPTASGTITPDTAYPYNSVGGTINIAHNGTGTYTVTFGQLGNSLNSNVEVTG